MMIEIQLWHLVSLLLSFFAVVWGFWKYVKSREEAESAETRKEVNERFTSIRNDVRAALDKIDTLARTLVDLGNKIVVCEKDIEMQRNPASYEALRGDIREVAADHRSMRSEILEIRRALNQINDFLLNRTR
ncbi:MAG: hypothetical protein LBP58_03250 [Azoarcus sp.]|jgi:predicted  nucleic acid-binding Zn-ribbon protein|nr:hypothetical protein [Azoarcus sp.]